VDTENRQALRRYRHLICIEESEARIGEQVLDGGVDALVAEGRDLGARAGEAAPGQSPLGLRYGSEVLRTPSPLVGLDHQRPSVNQLDTSDTARRGPKNDAVCTAAPNINAVTRSNQPATPSGLIGPKMASSVVESTRRRRWSLTRSATLAPLTLASYASRSTPTSTPHLRQP